MTLPNAGNGRLENLDLGTSRITTDIGSDVRTSLLQINILQLDPHLNGEHET